MADQNVRQVGFEMIRELSELQEAVLFARYDQDDARRSKGGLGACIRGEGCELCNAGQNSRASSEIIRGLGDAICDIAW